MADETADSKVKRAKRVTFVYSRDGKVLLGLHETNACSIQNAFDEFSTPGEDVMFIGAIAGHHDFMKEHIRKPTYDELAAMVAKKE